MFSRALALVGWVLLWTAVGNAAEVTAVPEVTRPGLRTREPITLISANDGHSHLKMDMSYYTSNVPYLKLTRTNLTQDSFTVIRLGPDHPPRARTVYGTVPNTILGSPYLATSRDGRLGFVPCHNTGWLGPKPGNVLSVIDLTSTDLKVVQKVPIAVPTLAVSHPDGKHLIVSCATGFQVFQIGDAGLKLAVDNQLGLAPDSFDISPQGDRIIAAIAKAPEVHEITEVWVFRFKDGTIQKDQRVGVRKGLPGFDQPFSLRFTPDGRRVLAPNGGGGSSKGKLDDLLIIDMTLNPPEVTDAIRQVADGIESVAVHPSGRFAVAACLEDCPGDAVAGYSHLSVIDLTVQPAVQLYEVPIEPYPEGIEFTPDGSQLFVQLTAANRIAVYDVNEFVLRRSPYVIRVGHAPASMGLARSFRAR